jgi:NAD(P)H-hydrate epimerase
MERMLSRDQVRRLDRRALDEWGVPGIVLMENAGRNATDVIDIFLGPCQEKRFAIVAGTGNNGGDGFVVARHLSIRGAKVQVFLIGSEEKLTGDAATNFHIIRKLGLPIVLPAGEELKALAERLKEHDVVIDAVGGTGITGPLRGDAAEAVRAINAGGKDVVAVDIPTGLDCDTGQAHEPTVKAKLTVTMAANKVGFAKPGAADYTGRVIVVDIGVPNGD